MKVLKLSDLDLNGKRVFIRADLNVPQDEHGKITEDTRIRASIPGIKLALERGAAAARALSPVGDRPHGLERARRSRYAGAAGGRGR